MSAPVPPVTRCLCKLADCAYYTAVANLPDQCDCKHADKPHYMFNPCPLYRKNWQQISSEKMAAINAIKKKRTI